MFAANIPFTSLIPPSCDCDVVNPYMSLTEPHMFLRPPPLYPHLHFFYLIKYLTGEVEVCTIFEINGSILSKTEQLVKWWTAVPITNSWQKTNKWDLLEIDAGETDVVGVPVGEQLIELASWLHAQPSHLHTGEIQIWAQVSISIKSSKHLAFFFSFFCNAAKGRTPSAVENTYCCINTYTYHAVCLENILLYLIRL